MKRSRPRNQRLSSDRERRKKYFVAGVVKRGTSTSWREFWRWTGRLSKVLALAALAVGIYYGATHGWRKFFWQNPDYALRDIHFTTDGSLTREQALQTIRLRPGQNIFSYSIPAATEALRKLPQVDTVEVRRYLPNRIDINVRERTPTAWVVPKLSDKAENPGHAYLLDASGLVFQPRYIPHEFKTLPTIGGVQIEDLEPGKRIRKSEVDAALELLRRASDTGAFKVITIDVSKGYCMVATDQRRAQLTFGLDDIAGQLDRLAVVQSETALIGQEVQTVNLIPVRNVPVTFQPPEPPESDELAEPPPPAATKTVSTGKAKAAAPNPAKSKAPSSGKRGEPSRTREEPKNETIGLLKRFRAA